MGLRQIIVFLREVSEKVVSPGFCVEDLLESLRGGSCQEVNGDDSFDSRHASFLQHVVLSWVGCSLHLLFQRGYILYSLDPFLKVDGLFRHVVLLP